MDLNTLRNEIRDLGFEDDTIFNDVIFSNTFLSSVTRALKMIANTVKPPLAMFDLELNDTGRYDLSELTKDENGNVTFDRLEKIVLNDSEGIQSYGSYDIELGKILILNPKLKKDWKRENPKEGESEYRYSLTLIYRQRIPTITNDFVGDLPVEYSCEPLLGLLTAYFVWLDDDPTKATLYWNNFDSAKNEILGFLEKPTGRIIV